MIKETEDVNVALSAAAEWADRYTLLYQANAQKGWSANDQALLETAMTKLWDEAVGQYLDPAALAFGLALVRYFPKLAATVKLAGGPYVTFFVGLLAPVPTANDFTMAEPDNAEINRLLMKKLPPLTRSTIENRFPELFKRAYSEVKSPKTLP